MNHWIVIITLVEVVTLAQSWSVAVVCWPRPDARGLRLTEAADNFLGFHHREECRGGSRLTIQPETRASWERRRRTQARTPPGWGQLAAETSCWLYTPGYRDRDRGLASGAGCSCRPSTRRSRLRIASLWPAAWRYLRYQVHCHYCRSWCLPTNQSQLDPTFCSVSVPPCPCPSAPPRFLGLEVEQNCWRSLIFLCVLHDNHRNLHFQDCDTFSFLNQHRVQLEILILQVEI